MNKRLKSCKLLYLYYTYDLSSTLVLSNSDSGPGDGKDYAPHIY